MTYAASKPDAITLTPRLIPIVLTLLLALAPRLCAQATASAPLPTQLLTANTAFLANAGIDNATSTQAYNTFYQSLDSWNHFHLKPTPAAAELTFELSINTLVANVNNGSSLNSTYLHLVIRDTKTNALLWSLSENIRPAARQKTFDTNLNDAATKLLADLKAVTSSTTAPAAQ
jgi:hypothetical protein